MLTKFSLSLIFCLLITSAFSQKSGDKKIIITFPNDSALYEKAKLVLAKHDFSIREDGNKDTITTQLREFRTIPGYCIFNAVINGNTITLSGIYGLKKRNIVGYTTAPKDYKSITYYSGSKGWRLLMSVAEEMGGQISFSK